MDQRANALAHLKAAKILGGRFARIDAGGKGDHWTQEQFDHIVKRYREYAQQGAFSHLLPRRNVARILHVYEGK
jgi:hypothetical protein